MKPSFTFIIALTIAAPAFADTLTQAVGFALTGSDDAKVRTIDRQNCVFSIGNETYYLNNVQTDRISIRSWGKKLPNGRTTVDYYTVDLHGGDARVNETLNTPTTPSEEEMPPELARELKRQTPDYFKPRPSFRTSSNEVQVRLATTSEVERVNRAWSFIYANGCTGKKSPF